MNVILPLPFAFYALLFLMLPPPTMASESRDSFDLDLPDVTTYSGHLFSLSLGKFPGLGSDDLDILIGELDPSKEKSGDDFALSPLPSWLSYNTSTKTLEGIPSNTEKGQRLLVVAAKCRRPGTGCLKNPSRAVFQINVINRQWSQTSPATLLSLNNPSNMEQQENMDILDGMSVGDGSVECMDNTVLASLILCTSLTDMSTSSKIQVIKNLARFLSFPVKAIGIESSSTQTLKAVEFGYQLISAGPGSGDENCPLGLDENTEIVWRLPCQMVKHLADFVKVLQHNVDSGRLQQETGFSVVGWYVASSDSLKTRKQRRRKRYAGGLRTPIPTPTLTPPSPSVVMVQPSSQEMSYSSHVIYSSSESDSTSSMPLLSSRLAGFSSKNFLVDSSQNAVESISPSSTSSFVSSQSILEKPSASSLSSSESSSLSLISSSKSSSSLRLFSSKMVIKTNVESSLQSSVEPSISLDLTPSQTGIESHFSGASISPEVIVTSLKPSIPLSASHTLHLSMSESSSQVASPYLEGSNISPAFSHSSDSNSVSVGEINLYSDSNTQLDLLQPSQSVFTHTSSFRVIGSQQSTPSLTNTHPLSAISKLPDHVQSQFDVSSKEPGDIGSSSMSDYLHEDSYPSWQGGGIIIYPTSSLVDDSIPVTEEHGLYSPNEFHSVSLLDAEFPLGVDQSSKNLFDEVSSPLLDIYLQSESLDVADITNDIVISSSPISSMEFKAQSQSLSETDVVEVTLTPMPMPSFLVTDFVSSYTEGDSKEILSFSQYPITALSDFEYVDAMTSAITLPPSPSPSTTQQHSMASEGVGHLNTTVAAAVTSANTTTEVITTTSATTTTTSTTAAETTTDLDMTTEEVASQGTTDCVWNDCLTTQEPANSPPVVENPLGLIIGEQGRVLEMAIPGDVFRAAPQGGDTNSMHLHLELPSGEPLPDNFWLYLVNSDRAGGGSAKKILKGLPLHQDRDINNMSIVLVATDSNGLQARDSILLQINGNASPRTQFTHKFTLRFAIDFQSFIHKRDNIVQLMSRIASHFNDSSAHFMTVLEVRQGSFILSWTNNTLSGPVCQRQAIKQLLNRMVRIDGTVRSSFNRKIGRKLEMMEIGFEPLGSCIIPTTTTTTTTTVLSSSRTGPALSIWAHIILPILIAIVVFIFILFLIFICNRHRKRQEALNIIEKDAFSNDRNPIIFPNEMESDDPVLLPKSPLVLPSDTPSTHHSSIDSPQHYQQQRPQQQQHHHHHQHHQRKSHGKHRDYEEESAGGRRGEESKLKSSTSSSSSPSSPSSSSMVTKNQNNHHRKSKDKRSKKSSEKEVGFYDPPLVSSDRPSHGNYNGLEDEAPNSDELDSNVNSPNNLRNIGSSGNNATRCSDPLGNGGDVVPITHSPTKRQPPPYWQASKHHPPPYFIPPPHSNKGKDDDDDDDDCKVGSQNKSTNKSTSASASAPVATSPSNNENPFLKASCTTTQV